MTSTPNPPAIPPLLKDMKAQSPNAVCDIKPQYVHRNLMVNREAAPFNNPELRKALALAIDRKPFIAAVQKFYASGKHPDGSALPWPSPRKATSTS